MKSIVLPTSAKRSGTRCQDTSQALFALEARKSNTQREKAVTVDSHGDRFFMTAKDQINRKAY
jgi:hypothetical protein